MLCAMTHWKAERSLSARSTMSEVFVKQFGSGGRSWNSLNHVNADECVDVRIRGYEASCDAGTLRGYRAEPTMLVEGDSTFLSVTVPEFWQQFPGSMAAAMGTLEVGLFPALESVTHELQGGEQKTQSFWIATGQGTGCVNDLDWVHDRPRLVQAATEVAETGTLPWFCTTANHAVSGRLDRYLLAATTGRFSLNARRDSIDE